MFEINYSQLIQYEIIGETGDIYAKVRSYLLCSDQPNAKMCFRFTGVSGFWTSTIQILTVVWQHPIMLQIFSHHAKNYLDWNLFPNLRSPLFLKQTVPGKTTIKCYFEDPNTVGFLKLDMSRFWMVDGLVFECCQVF